MEYQLTEKARRRDTPLADTTANAILGYMKGDSDGVGHGVVNPDEIKLELKMEGESAEGARSKLDSMVRAGYLSKDDSGTDTIMGPVV